MILIATFRCYEGVIIGADSQETVGDYRVEVKKIKPRDAGAYDLIIGGSGNIAPLIDGQADAIERNVKNWPAGLDEESARQRLERTLIGYNVRHVKHYPVETPEDIPNYKEMCFIVCVRDKTTSKIHLWKTAATAAERIEDFALIGWGEAIYQHEAQRLYKRNAPALRCIMLGVHLFALAKATSNYIGPPTQIVGVCDRGTWIETPERVRKFEERMEIFNQMTAELLLDSADTLYVEEAFNYRLTRFQEKVMELREEYIRDAVRAARTLDGKPPYYDYPAAIPTRLLSDLPSKSQPSGSQKSEERQ